MNLCPFFLFFGGVFLFICGFWSFVVVVVLVAEERPVAFFSFISHCNKTSRKCHQEDYSAL